MARARSARGEGVLSIAIPQWRDLRAILDVRLSSTDVLRRLVPILLIAFGVVAFAGFASQIGNGKDAALTSAQRQLALIADVTALNLKDQAPKSAKSWQKTLAGSLPKRATRDGRTALLADAEGNIQARAPISNSPLGNLLTILGPQQPLTIMGADAGVLQITLSDGTDAIVTVRNVPKTDVQVAFVQPVSDALRDWRSGAIVEITLLVCAGLVLALTAGGLCYLIPSAAREGADTRRLAAKMMNQSRDKK